MAQTPPVDPSFYSSFERMGIVAMLVAIICFGTWFFMRLLNRESARADRLDAENSELTRSHERMSVDAITAVREMSREIDTLKGEVGSLEKQLSILIARMEK